MKSDEFIREVNEELQRDRLTQLWQRYGKLAVTAVVLLVVAVAASEAWSAWRRSQLQAEAERFAAAEAALAAGRAAEAANAFAAVAADSGPGFAALSRLREAAALESAGRQAEAAAALEQVAAKDATDALLKDLAVLLAVSSQIDGGDPATLQQRLLPLAEAGRPWRSTARELLALLAIRKGETEEARRLLDDLIAEAGAPPAQQRRVEALRQTLGAAGS